MDVTLTSHSNDPPAEQHEQGNADGAIDPILVASVGAESTHVPDDDKALKKTWLTLLPIEQVIEIVMKLDENVPQNVREEVWPTDLKASVFHAAVAKIMESSGKGNAHDVLKSLEISDASGMKVGAEVIQNGQPLREETSAPPESTAPEEPPATASTLVESAQPSTKTSLAPLPTASPIEAPAAAASPASVPSTTTVPPLTSTIPHSSPATSTTTYQAASSSYAYSYPYTSGSYSYQHSANHQPYSYSYSPSAGSTSYSPAPPPSLPPRVPPASGAITIAEDDDDLPSYEEMLVQALTVHNDPAGTAPKQLFQWMAATYPLQANFRPSASQALQKAFKRGRFEKNKEGKYRLNSRWEGGNTSRRTTRRPQSYSKAVTNPSPSSHPPANTSQYPPQHYTWTYGAGKAARSQSQSQSPAPPTPGPPPPAEPEPEPEPEPAVASAREETEQESHRSCMEAAYSILQALNVTSPFNGVKTGEREVSAPPEPTASEANTSDPKTTTTPNAPSALISAHKGADLFPSPVVVGDSSLPTSSRVKEPSFSALPSSQRAEALASGAISDATPLSTDNRAALQGSLALLAAQLAELADSVEDDAGGDSSVPEWPTPAEASTTSASASASSALNLLEGFGLNMFGSSAWAGLRGVDMRAKQ